MRILIVEDDDRIAKPLAEFLRRQHHIVDITTDGLEAWEWSQSAFELRSPLMAIKINAELPLEYPEEIGTKDAEKFQAIANATNQMTRLTENLLMLARTDRVSNQNRDTLNLTSILENLIQLYKPQAEAKQIDLKIQLIANLQLIGD